MAIALASANDLAAITGKEADDAVLLLALRRASSVIRRYTRQTISAVSDDTVKLHAGRAKLILPERPVTALTTITVLRYGPFWMPLGDAPFGPLPVDSYTWDGLAEVELTFARCWPELVQVTYSHGYSTIPDEIEDVCLDIAARKMSNPDALRQESIAGYAYTRAVQPGELTDLERSTLDSYRRRTYG